MERNGHLFLKSQKMACKIPGRCGIENRILLCFQQLEIKST